MGRGKVKGKLKGSALCEREPVNVRDVMSGEMYNKIPELHESGELTHLEAEVAAYKDTLAEKDLMKKIIKEPDFASLVNKAYKYASVECGSDPFGDFVNWVNEFPSACEWGKKYNACPGAISRMYKRAGKEFFLKVSSGLGLKNYLSVGYHACGGGEHCNT